MSAGTTPVTLPGGCYGLQLQSSGREFNAKPGGTVHVPDEHLSEVQASNAAQNGIISVGLHLSVGTRRGRPCTRHGCNFIAQAWSDECPRCGAPTASKESI